MKCKKCLHEEACAAWIRHGETLYDDFEYSVDGCPYYTAKAVHGHWIVSEHGHVRDVQCSVCGKDYACHYGMLQLQNFSYCPNCGSLMDGDKDGK